MNISRRLRSALAAALFTSLGATPPADAGVPSDLDAMAAADTSSAQATWTARSANSHGVRRQAALVNRARSEGTIPIIVRFKTLATGAEGSSGTQRKAAAVSLVKRKALSELGLVHGLDRAGNPIKHFAQVPGLAMQADALDLSDLLANPDVEDVVEDVPYPPALVETLPLLGASADRSFSGYSGQGQVVAILDTGVDKTHPFLASKVISEACYSTTYVNQSTTSLCPGGVRESTASGSGANCTGISGCDHGTHVAGIAAGNGGGFSGVAKDAKVIAIQIYSKFPASACGSTAPCVMAFTSDIIKGLERVHALSGTYSIAAANLSLGGGAYTSPCDTDPTKPSIDKLLSAGIATVVASGNNGYYNAVSSPGCVSTAITVGSTTKSDKVSSFSNSASFLDLLAPGESIKSSVPGGIYQYWNGTSMAAPHVAGIWAVMKSAAPTAGVAAILSALQSTGLAVTDPDSGVSTSRPRVDTALAAISGSMPDLPPPLAKPATNVTASGFAANWSSVSAATTYLVDVSTNSGFTTFVPGYEAIEAGSPTALTVVGLAPGTGYFYRVRAADGTDASAYSNTVSVQTTASGPAAPTALDATNLKTNGFTANWSSIPGTTAYVLDVATDSGFTSLVSGYTNLNVKTALYKAVSGLSAGRTYFYRVRATNKVGSSGHSNVITATTKIAPPAAPKALAASNLTASSFSANWSPANGAAQYFLDISSVKNFTSFLSGYQNRAVGVMTTQAIGGLPSGTTYYYRVRAANAGGTSASSGTITAKTLLLPPAAPTATPPTSITATTFTANWVAVTGATGYYLDVSTDAGFGTFIKGYQNVNLKTALSRNVTGLNKGTTYYYRVRASNGAGASPNSATSSVTTKN